LQRHGVSRLPRPARESKKGRFKGYEVGYFHIDICEVRVEQGKAHLFVAVDRTSKLAFARLYRRATTLTAAAFLKALLKAVPYRIHTVLTDNGIQFCDSADPRRYEHARSHAFEPVCRQHGIEHRLTKPYHPWTNGQAERMVRTLKEATVRAYHYETYRQLRRHVADYLAAYNFAKHLKALRWKTPYETLRALWESKPELFHHSPDHLTLGPNTPDDPALRAHRLWARSPSRCPSVPLWSHSAAAGTGGRMPNTGQPGWAAGHIRASRPMPWRRSDCRSRRLRAPLNKSVTSPPEPGVRATPPRRPTDRA